MRAKNATIEEEAKAYTPTYFLSNSNKDGESYGRSKCQNRKIHLVKFSHFQTFKRQYLAPRLEDGQEK
jgi:hypothetical protein